MNKVVWSFFLGTVGFISSQQTAHAQTAAVILECNTSDICMVDVNSAGSPPPYSYTWSFSNTSGVIFPAPCNEICEFYCPSTIKNITATVTVTDANKQLIGSASAATRCTPDPL